LFLGFGERLKPTALVVCGLAADIRFSGLTATAMRVSEHTARRKPKYKKSINNVGRNQRTTYPPGRTA